MLGVILLPVMLAGGIFLWYKRRKARKELEMLQKTMILRISSEKI